MWRWAVEQEQKSTGGRWWEAKSIQQKSLGAGRRWRESRKVEVQLHFPTG